jgi:hypothetical protein
VRDLLAEGGQGNDHKSLLVKISASIIRPTNVKKSNVQKPIKVAFRSLDDIQGVA